MALRESMTWEKPAMPVAKVRRTSVSMSHLSLFVVVLVVHILDEVQHVDVQAGQPVQHLDVLGQHLVVVQVLAGDGA